MRQKKLIKKDLFDLMIVDGSESELEVSLEMSSNAQKTAKSSALNQNITTLRNRVNELGVCRANYSAARV